MTSTGSPADRLAAVRDRLSSRTSRRRFLRVAGTTGYGLGLASLLGVDEFLAADEGEVPVVTALVREDRSDPSSLTSRTRAVPADWYARVSKAFALHEQVAARSITGLLGSAVRPGSYDRGTATLAVEVRPEDADQVGEALEMLLAGEEVTIESVRRHPPEDASGEPRLAGALGGGPVPGGVRCRTGDRVATLGPALYRDGSAYFTTAEHAYGEGATVGDPLSLPRRDAGTVEIGRVRHVHPAVDVVAVSPTGGFEPESAIDGATPSRVIGQLTRFGLADLAARGEPLEKVGAQTGHTTGEILGIDAVTCVTGDCRRGQLQWGTETDLTDGDSGSAAYYPTEEGLLIAGFNNARTWWPGQNHLWGVAAYHLTETHGYHF
ncbi:hypothetical protein [Saliphagus infecundisoli]|uniref:Uncharacterized protein n=1 Tax=Saliphagus infecundisoli TaxID=1849069 RepID=A0ABD5QBP9_9EURY|nr:hypothetical protein [Saliphagus infecundisoli]